MRIISGIYGGRKINPPAKMPFTRPTTDIAKEGLFNILQNNLDISSVKALDLFGGTGSISYELASRGAAEITVVEKDKMMFEFIKKTGMELELKCFRVVQADVFTFLQFTCNQYDLIFAGPPYALTTINKLPGLVFDRKLLHPGGWFVLEHTPKNDYKKEPYYKTERNYGTTIFSIFINK